MSRPDTDRPASAMRMRHLCGIAMIATLYCMIAACSHGTSSPASSSHATATEAATSNVATWTANGATACDTYLTPPVVAQILKNPGGHTKKLSPQACSYETTDFSSITITLIGVGTTGLDLHMKYLTDPVPVAGIGDKAVRSVLGLEAAKGTDRMCSIGVMPPFAAKESGEALAQKLGTICNQLFALP